MDVVLEVRSDDECALLGWLRACAPPGGLQPGQLVEVLVPLQPKNLVLEVLLRLCVVEATPTVPAPPYGLAAMATLTQYVQMQRAPAFTDITRVEQRGPVLPPG